MSQISKDMRPESLKIVISTPPSLSFLINSIEINLDHIFLKKTNLSLNSSHAKWKRVKLETTQHPKSFLLRKLPGSEWFAAKKQVGLGLLQTDSSSQPTWSAAAARFTSAWQTVNTSAEVCIEKFNKPFRWFLVFTCQDMCISHISTWWSSQSECLLSGNLGMGFSAITCVCKNGKLCMPGRK